MRSIPRVSLATIDAVVTAHLGPARVRGHARPEVFYRQIAMYLAKHAGGWSTTRIGKFYNGRDHSTVCHSIRRIEMLRKMDPVVSALLDRLTKACEEEGGGATAQAVTSKPSVSSRICLDSIDEDLLDALADRIAERLTLRLSMVARLS